MSGALTDERISLNSSAEPYLGVKNQESRKSVFDAVRCTTWTFSYKDSSAEQRSHDFDIIFLYKLNRILFVKLLPKSMTEIDR